jgi:hypothetical protein
LNFEAASGVRRFERSVAIENKSAHGEPVEPPERLELTGFLKLSGVPIFTFEFLLFTFFPARGIDFS